ncbi:hypothetical protein [Candidatus Cardinium hertigii]|uniref:Uncharacterized protein n=1 Tax=Candidatus Cardinium hertigii TaxID=247481 RepID=A0A2Z3LCF2_9BACT|nr:hypothetical protein [Candidatus Cardinium hertigii]AWN81606.1 hypothetical protein DK880_00274 [Candidatus Cardinium hertigii]
MDLCRNRIGYEDAKALAKVLTGNRAVTYLNLNANGIGNIAALGVALYKLLKDNQSIKNID